MSGPPVQQVTRVESFEILKANNPIFFIYVGQQTGNLWNTYYTASENNQAHGYFYATGAEVASKHFFIESTPVILVYKENTHYTFPLSDNYDLVDAERLNSSLHTWITQEKFLTFPKITRGEFIFQLNIFFTNEIIFWQTISIRLSRQESIWFWLLLKKTSWKSFPHMNWNSETWSSSS